MFAQMVPGPLVRTFAKPYLAGSSIEAALDAAARALERGMLCTLDLLGEAVSAQAQVEEAEATYRAAIEAIASDARFEAPQRPTVSMKPSAFVAETKAGRSERSLAFQPIERLLEHAGRCGVASTIDMEDRSWTDVTLEHAVRLYSAGYDVGTVLQSRLFRTETDLCIIPKGMRIRLVIGIYPEPAEVAMTKKPEMKEKLLHFAKMLLEQGAYVEFATHDDAYVQRFVKEVAPSFLGQCELQLLLGVPRDRMIARLRKDPVGSKLPIRLYVPFSTDMKQATAYLRRRLHESPGMVFHVLKNLGGG